MPSNTVSLSAPYTLFALQQPLALTQHGEKTKKGETSQPKLRNISTSPVVTSPAGASHRKRKRGQAELCAAIDGEGVNIYNAATTQIVSAYALPPATKFSSAPVSLRTTSSDGRITRRTFAAASAPKAKIIAWVETQEDATSESLTLGPQSEKVLGKKHKVAFLELVAHSEKKSADFDVAVVEENGSMYGLSSDLKEERWSYNSGWENGKAVFVKSASLSQIKNSILEDRTPIDFASASTNLEDPVFLVLYQTSPTQFHLDVVLLARVEGKIKAQRVLRTNFPAITTKGQLDFALELSNGKLQIADNNSLYAYDLSTSTPSLVSELKLSATAGRHTLLQLSPTSLLVSGPEDIILYDTLYSSVQARASRAETEETNSSNDAIILTTWMDNLNLAVGFSRDGLKAVQLSREGGSSLSFDKEGRLIDSLCRGIGDVEVSTKFPPAVEKELVQKESAIRADFAGQKQKDKKKQQHGIQALETSQNPLKCTEDFTDYLYEGLLPTIAKEEALSRKVLDKLEKAKEKGDIEKYEHIFSEYCNIKLHPQEVETRLKWKEALAERRKAAKATTAPTDDDVPMASDSEDDLKEPPLPSFLHPIAYKNNRELFRLDRHRNPEYHNLSHARYPDLPYNIVFGVISHLFTLGEDDKLEFDFYSFNILEFLVGCGVFKNTVIGQVKRSLGGSSLAPGEIVDALVKEDSSLDLLNWYFHFAEEIFVDDIVRGIKVILEGVEADSTTPAVPAIEEAPTSADTPEAQLQFETAAAERDIMQIDLEVRRLNNRETIIDYALRRLNRFPNDLIVSSLKTGLSGELMLSFIRHLQHALADLSDPSDFDTPMPEAPLLQISANNAALIVDILTAALDAVGLTGLILSNEPAVPEEHDEEDPQLLIASLHEQVSLSVQSLEESSAVARLLDEMLRHAALVHPPAITTAKTPKQSKTPKTPKKEKAARLAAQKKYEQSTIKAIEGYNKAHPTPVVPDTPVGGSAAAHDTPTPIAAGIPQDKLKQIIAKVPVPKIFKNHPPALPMRRLTGHGKRGRDRERKLQKLSNLSLSKRLQLSTKDMGQRKGRPEPETVLAVRRMVSDMLPIWSGSDKAKKAGVVKRDVGPKVGKNELGLGLGNVMGGGRYVVERVDV